ncbi:uncharacterized protein LOC126899163 [Daktulosphaira vitifoliae]|uniref:uncharacterized protein LOC126899163 n=1 Tax=Daktulosphaira vitifoliae TaxID=58002 RepID=UPI0021AAB4B3|nr:uncharacterized protein LOC126899163 [Daktulosphaira vitifoliae]
MSFVCGCGSSFVDSTGLNVHCSMNQGHRQTVISGKRYLSAPAGRVTKRACMHVAGTGFVPIESALRGRVIHYFLKNETTIDEIDDFIRYVSDDLTTVLNDVTKHGIIKFNVVLHTTYIHQVMGEMRDVSFKTRNKTVDSGTVYAAVFDGITEKLVYEQQEMETRGSGWSLLFIDGLLLRVTKITPFSGDSYVELPQCIKQKFAVINVRNADQQCFKWAILCKYNKNKKNKDQWNAGYIDLEKSTNIRFDGLTLTFLHH